MAEYAVSMIAQQWRSDPYYVASSGTKYPVTVVAGTKQDALNEAARILGEPPSGYVWKFFNIEMKNARLVREPTESQTGEKR